jgi:hypothetical protein
VSAPTNSLCERCVSDGALKESLHAWKADRFRGGTLDRLLTDAATALEARIAACGCKPHPEERAAVAACDAAEAKGRREAFEEAERVLEERAQRLYLSAPAAMSIVRQCAAALRDGASEPSADTARLDYIIDEWLSEWEAAQSELGQHFQTDRSLMRDAIDAARGAARDRPLAQRVDGDRA